MHTEACNYSKPLCKDTPHTATLIFRVADAVGLGIAGFLASQMVQGTADDGLSLGLLASVSLVLALLMFEWLGVYRSRLGLVAIQPIVCSLKALAVTGVFLWIASARLLPGMDSAEGMRFALVWGLVGCAAVVWSRVIGAPVLAWLRKKLRRQHQIIIVGHSKMALSVTRQINASPWLGLTVMGYVDDVPTTDSTAPGCRLPHLGAVSDLPGLVTAALAEGQRICVWIAYGMDEVKETERVLHLMRHLTVNIRMLVDCFAFEGIAPGRRSVTEIAGIPTLDVTVSPLVGANVYIKELEDRLLALLLLVALSPFMIAIAIGVKLSSPGPVFYRQERVGWNGRPFMMFKFRSMPVDVEAKTGARWAKPGDNRATPFGALLRRTSLDELPQLFNVLWGDMSLVGPRPERTVFVEKFKDEVPLYMKKHMVKAGITGWAQVNGWRGDTDLEERIRHDLYYIQHWSLWFDLWIALKTVTNGLVHKNAY